MARICSRAQRMEHDDVVDAVDELRPEVLLHDLHHRALHARVVLLARELLDDLRAEVRGHDDDGVAEVDRAALAVGQAAVVEHLQQHVEHVRVRLLDLIEQDHRVRPAAHRLGEIAALLVADVARRRADQARHRVLLHELGHVDADHGLFGVEQELRQRLAQLGLADAGGPEEQERAVRPARIGEARARAADRIRRRCAAPRPGRRRAWPAPLPCAAASRVSPSSILETGMPVHLETTSAISSSVTLLRTSCRRLVSRRPAPRRGASRAPECLPYCSSAMRARSPARRAASSSRRVRVRAPPGSARRPAARPSRPSRSPRGRRIPSRSAPSVSSSVARRLREASSFSFFSASRSILSWMMRRSSRSSASGLESISMRMRAAGLVDQVDGLVGQLPVGDVAVRQRRRGDDGRIGDLDAVVHLVALLRGRAGSRSCPRPTARRPAPSGSAARAPRPSRCTCGIRRAWSRRRSAARRARAPA